MRVATLSGNVVSAPTHILYLHWEEIAGEDWIGGYATNTVYVCRRNFLTVGSVYSSTLLSLTKHLPV